jgi:hypothetical protein
MKSDTSAFRFTQVKISPAETRILRKDPMVWLGSCFVESFAPFLSDYRYKAETNPFGVVFHPLVLEKLIAAGVEDFKPYNFEKEGVWLNYLLGTPFAAQSQEELEEKIATVVLATQEKLKGASWLVMTWGTAFWYEHTELGRVGKCHKQPGQLFAKKRSSPEEIAEVWTRRIHKMREQNPELRILLTLSPVRHTRDGLEENALSKATLRLAIAKVQESLPGVYYFPSFEIVVDELRDYRFFKSDLVHPSEEAVEYIWEKFSTAWFDPEEVITNQKIRELRQLESHRPLVPYGGEFERWKYSLDQKREEVGSRLRAESVRKN